MKKITFISIFVLCGWLGAQAQVLLTVAPMLQQATTVVQSNSTVSSTDDAPKFVVNGKKLTVTNLEVGVTVDIYSVLGAKVHSFVYKGSAETLNLNKGIYIVRTGKFTQKIIL